MNLPDYLRVSGTAVSLSDYLRVARTTARYPGAGTHQGDAVIYLGLGLVGESTEVLAADVRASSADVTAELGDVCWYWSQLSYELNFDIDELGFAGASAESEPTAALVSTGLVVAAGRVAELCKKALRDDAGTLTNERRTRLGAALVQVLRCWLDVVEYYALNVDDVLAGNQAKLASRRERNVLSGDGDYR